MYEIKYAKKFKYYINNKGTITILGFNHAFHQKKASISIPEKINGIEVEAIDDGAFENEDRISQVFIPATVSYVGAGAFMNSSVQTVSIANRTAKQDCVILNQSCFENCNNLTLFKSQRLILTAEKAFAGCEKLREVSADFLKIDRFVFQNCEGLKKFYFYNDLTHIEAKAFDGCSNLRELVVLKDFIAPQEFVEDFFSDKTVVVNKNSAFKEMAYLGYDLKVL